MNGEFDVYGAYFPALIIFASVAFLLHLVVKRLFEQLGVYRFVWLRPLFDLALYVIMLGAVTVLGTSVFLPI